MTYREAVRAAKRDYLESCLREAGSIRGAAKLAGLNRTALHRLIVELDVQRPGHLPKAHRGTWYGL